MKKTECCSCKKDIGEYIALCISKPEIGIRLDFCTSCVLELYNVIFENFKTTLLLQEKHGNQLLESLRRSYEKNL
jgi:hypothetical protein